MRSSRVAVLAACVAASCFHDAGESPWNHDSSGSSDDALAYLPVDADFVVGVDLGSIRASSLWSHFEAVYTRVAKDELAMVRSSCGFDPMKTVTRVTVGLNWPGKGDLTGVVVVRGVDPTHMLACLADEFGKHGETVTDRGTVIIDPKSDSKRTAWTIVGHTLVGQIGRNVGHDTLATKIANGSPLRTSPTFLAMFDHLEHGASMWGIVRGTSEAVDMFDDEGVRPRTVDGTIAITDRVTVAARFKMADPAAALKLTGLMTKDLAEAKEFLARHDAVANGETIKVDLAVTSQQLAAMIATARFN